MLYRRGRRVCVNVHNSYQRGDRPGYVFSNDHKAVKILGPGIPALNAAMKEAASLDFGDALNLKQGSLKRLPTTREALLRETTHSDPRTYREGLETHPTASQAEPSTVDYIKGQLAYYAANPGTSGAERRRREDTVRRLRNSLAAIEYLETVEPPVISEADQGRAIHGKQMLDKLNLSPLATVQDLEEAKARLTLTGGDYDAALSTWKTDFLQRAEPKVNDNTPMGEYKAMIELQNDAKKLVE